MPGSSLRSPTASGAAGAGARCRVTLWIANQDFSAVVGGVNVQVTRGDYYDDSTALFIECANAVPPLFTALPDGITSHKLVNPWEG